MPAVSLMPIFLRFEGEGCCGRPAACGSAALDDVSADEFLHDFGRSAEDRLDSGIAIGLGYGVFVHEAIATVQLEAAVDDALLELRHVPLSLRRIDR